MYEKAKEQAKIVNKFSQWNDLIGNKGVLSDTEVELHEESFRKLRCQEGSRPWWNIKLDIKSVRINYNIESKKQKSVMSSLGESRVPFD